MANTDVVKACVLIRRAKIENALTIAKQGDSTGPKGIAIRIKSEATMSRDEARRIDPSRIQLLAVFYKNGNLEGEKVLLEGGDLIVKGLDGSEYQGMPEWEHADSYTVSSREQDEADINFSFSFFQYDILNVILDRWTEAGEICAHGIFEYFLLGSVQMNLGAETGSLSTIYGDALELKLEPYCEQVVASFFSPLILGIPLYAIGFGCRRNWHKIDLNKNALSQIIADSMDVFVTGVEDLFA